MNEHSRDKRGVWRRSFNAYQYTVIATSNFTRNYAITEIIRITIGLIVITPLVKVLVRVPLYIIVIYSHLKLAFGTLSEDDKYEILVTISICNIFSHKDCEVSDNSDIPTGNHFYANYCHLVRILQRK